MRSLMALVAGIAWAQPPPPQPAEQVYKNIQILKGVPAQRVPTVMAVFNRVLGVECSHCHVEGAMEKDDKPAFAKTRKMFQMRMWIAQNENVNVTCWSCHHGTTTPNVSAPVAKSDWPADTAVAKLTPEQEKMPAETVYKSIRSLKGVPAGRLPFMMNLFSASLGVGCAHCHVEGAWEKEDRPAKETARKMLAVVGATLKQFYHDNGPIGCFTCHHGAVKPEINPPAAP